MLNEDVMLFCDLLPNLTNHNKYTCIIYMLNNPIYPYKYAAYIYMYRYV